LVKLNSPCVTPLFAQHAVGDAVVVLGPHVEVAVAVHVAVLGLVVGADAARARARVEQRGLGDVLEQRRARRAVGVVHVDPGLAVAARHEDVDVEVAVEVGQVEVDGVRLDVRGGSAHGKQLVEHAAAVVQEHAAVARPADARAVAAVEQVDVDRRR
jgi:hypothetical protein